MINFFRKIRRRLYNENKFSKYFQYAIGEILLVVIGILIALVINNYYLSLQNKSKIDTLLIQLQKELSIDILDAKRIYSSYIYKDSLARIIYNDELSLEEFNSFPIAFMGRYVSFSNNKNSYNRLMQNIELLPDQYAPLLTNLNLMYVETQNDIDDSNGQMKEVYFSRRNENYSTKPWLTDFYLNKDSITWAIQLHSDPYLKNKVHKYMAGIQRIAYASNTYRAIAINTYRKIDSLLDINREVYPDHLYPLDPNNMSSKNYEGTYTFDSGESIDVYLENDQLFSRTQNQTTKLWWHSGPYYYSSNSDFVRFTKNAQGQQAIEFMWTGMSFLGVRNN